MHVDPSNLGSRGVRGGAPSTETEPEPIRYQSVEEWINETLSGSVQSRRSSGFCDELEGLRKEMRETDVKIKLARLKHPLAVLTGFAIAYGLSGAAIELGLRVISMVVDRAGFSFMSEDVIELVSKWGALVPAIYFTHVCYKAVVSRFRSLKNSLNQQRERLCLFSDSMLDPEELKIKAEVRESRGTPF